MRYLIKIFVVSIILCGTAHAESYRCNFTEPFFDLVFYDRSQVMAFSGPESNLYDSHHRIVSIQKTAEKVEVKMEGNRKLVIHRYEVGSDGMSNLGFPHNGVFTSGGLSYMGGCTSTLTTNYNSTYERVASERNSGGLVLANFWVGEFGHVQGYKIEKDVEIPASEVWSDIRKGQKGTTACHLKKGKRIVPVDMNSREGEEYVTLQEPSILKAKERFPLDIVEIQAGQVITNLSYLSDGMCAYDVRGKVVDAGCVTAADQDPNFEILNRDQSEYAELELPSLGRWVKTRCENSGQYHWIHEDSLDKRLDNISISRIAEF